LPECEPSGEPEAKQPLAGGLLRESGNKNVIIFAYIFLLSINIGTSLHVLNHWMQLTAIVAAMPAAIAFVTATQNRKHSVYFSFNRGAQS
jgi:hypothetical protein